MSLLQSIILGVVEGFTEFLPISSTAHQVIVSHLMGLSETDFVKTFIIAIQLGAIAAVIVLYWKRFLHDWQTNMKVLVAFIPTAIIGFILYKLIKGVLLDNLGVIGITLLIGGVILILIERRTKPASTVDLQQISYKQAFIIGCAQALAVIPGVSRSGATIVGGLLLGIKRDVIVTFSFLLAVPTMVAATGYDLLKSSGGFSDGQFYLLAGGAITAFIFAIIGIKFFLRVINTRSFVPFGVYRIFLGLALILTYL